jgi:hypothetical protein
MESAEIVPAPPPDSGAAPRYVIQFVGLVSGGSSDVDGLYLESYDPNYIYPLGYDGGWLKTTTNLDLAEKFPTQEQAIAKWHTVAPPPYNIRPDGKLNKPLTAYNIAIIEV